MNGLKTSLAEFVKSHLESIDSDDETPSYSNHYHEIHTGLLNWARNPIEDDETTDKATRAYIDIKEKIPGQCQVLQEIELKRHSHIALRKPPPYSRHSKVLFWGSHNLEQGLITDYTFRFWNLEQRQFSTCTKLEHKCWTQSLQEPSLAWLPWMIKWTSK